MSAMICDLKAAGKKISEGEQALNVIWAILDELNRWGSVNLVLTNSKYLKTFREIKATSK